MSVDLKKEYHTLMVEKAELERSIERRQQKIKKLLLGIQALYQKCGEQEAKDQMIGEDNEVKWEPETRALELWSSAESVEEMQGTCQLEVIGKWLPLIDVNAFYLKTRPILWKFQQSILQEMVYALCEQLHYFLFISNYKQLASFFMYRNSCCIKT